jgi:hypothetical protein
MGEQHVAFLIVQTVQMDRSTSENVLARASPENVIKNIPFHNWPVPFPNCIRARALIES